MNSTCKFKVGDIVEHIGGRGNTGKVTRVTTDTITVVFEDSSKDYNYTSDTRSLRLVKEKTVETEYNYPIYKQYKKSALVIKFTGLRDGRVEIGDGKRIHAGQQLGLLTPHTDKTSWEDYTPESSTKHTSPKTVHKYPIYKKSKTNGVVVQFTALDCGFVTDMGDTLLDIGHYSSSWTPHTSDAQWEDYTPKPSTKHICEVLEEKVNLETAIKFAKNYTEWASSKDYLDSRINASSLINSFLWEDSKEGCSFWNKIDDYVAGIKATATYSTFTKYANMALPEEVEEQLSSTKKQKTKSIQTKTESTIMTKLKTTATEVATQNKDAIKVAAKLEAGKIINKQVIKQVKPHLPLLVRGLADHPAASIVLANVVSIAVKHFMPENKKLNTVAELMLGAAAVDTVASFNIEAFVEDLLKNIKLPTGALDDDN